MSTSHAEGLRLLRADNKAGYFGVYHNPGKPKPATLAARDTIKMSEPEGGLERSRTPLRSYLPRLLWRAVLAAPTAPARHVDAVLRPRDDGSAMRLRRRHAQLQPQARKK